jgi:hypothetical protein
MHPYDEVAMRKKYSPLHYIAMFIVMLVVLGTVSTRPNSAAQAQTAAATAPAPNSAKPGVLDRVQATAILPASVFYAGQSAPVQGRNSAGIRFDGGKLALVALVDATGYSSGVQQTYQGYLLTEVPLKIGDKTLPPGAYGFGFVEDDRMVVMDIGGNEILHTTTTRDEKMMRPTPLQMMADASAPGQYRLYLGRSYVMLSAAK